MPAATARVLGSSPLARGLHLKIRRTGGQSRIIPARAGFTRQLSPVWLAPRDHPRSRGVYYKLYTTKFGEVGSSPLARGLLERRRLSLGAGRIIPARAGFTRRNQRDFVAHQDHPRSRGVYSTMSRSAAGFPGSSPLARGLLPPGLDLLHGLGIIPARAGFTRRRKRPRPARPDHPRSRGVYCDEHAELDRGGGSSPLARGLHRIRNPWTVETGIIPARAGFTYPCALTATVRRDHPRSRGVYWSVTYRVGRPPGSSPLARGLLSVIHWGDDQKRIIPARAGFTLGDRRDSNGGPPYQGAFAFTGDLGTARLSCGSVVAGQRSTTTPSPV